MVAFLRQIPFSCFLINKIEEIFKKTPELQDTPPSISASLKAKMWKNAKKAIEEHKDKKSPGAYAVLEEGLPPLESLIVPAFKPLVFGYQVAEGQGVRPTMEDAHFYKETDEWVIAGVLDGHGGRQVAEHASQAFQEKFPQRLTDHEGNVHKALNAAIEEIQKEIAQNDEWNYIGSVAVFLFIDKKSSLVYTATIGDSEANIYRVINEQIKSIPLSCVRDWGCKKEARRAGEVLENPVIPVIWPHIAEPKMIRFPFPHYGVNVSRALGDLGWSDIGGKLGIITKPKITINQVRDGDFIVLACDGLKDYAREEEIIAQIARHEDPKTLAQHLVDYALGPKNSKDNVTVMTIFVKEKK